VARPPRRRTGGATYQPRAIQSDKVFFVIPAAAAAFFVLILVVSITFRCYDVNMKMSREQWEAERKRLLAELDATVDSARREHLHQQLRALLDSAPASWGMAFEFRQNSFAADAVLVRAAPPTAAEQKDASDREYREAVSSVHDALRRPAPAATLSALLRRALDWISAVGDRDKRRRLEIIGANPGLTNGQLCEQFDLDRIPLTPQMKKAGCPSWSEAYREGGFHAIDVMLSRERKKARF
jgi:hypothetical protein